MLARLLRTLLQCMLVAAMTSSADAQAGNLEALIQAAERGDLDGVKEALAADTRVDALDEIGRTALMAASGNGYLEVVEYLVGPAKAHVGVVDAQGEDALFRAVKRGRLPVAKFLLKRGANPKARNKDKETLLFAAVESKKPEMLGWVLDLPIELNAVDYQEQSALAAAARAGWVEGTTLLFERGASSKGALRFSVLAGNVELSRFLLERGAAVDELDDMKCTALSTAAIKGRLAMVKLLLERGASATYAKCEGRASAVFGACLYEKEESTEVVRELLKAGAKPDVGTGPGGGTALWVAADRGYLERVKVLLAAGANPNKTDDFGATPLMRAAGNGHEEIVRMLLEHDAAPGARDQHQKTAADYAREGKHPELAERLRALAGKRAH